MVIGLEQFNLKQIPIQNHNKFELTENPETFISDKIVFHY